MSRYFGWKQDKHFLQWNSLFWAWTQRMLWEETHTACDNAAIVCWRVAVLCFSLTPSFVLCNTRPLLGFTQQGPVRPGDTDGWCSAETLRLGVRGKGEDGGVFNRFRASVTHYFLVSMYCITKQENLFHFQQPCRVITKLWFHGCRFVRVVLNKYLKNDSIVVWHTVWPFFSHLRCASCFSSVEITRVLSETWWFPLLISIFISLENKRRGFE